MFTAFTSFNDGELEGKEVNSIQGTCVTVPPGGFFSTIHLDSNPGKLVSRRKERSLSSFEISFTQT